MTSHPLTSLFIIRRLTPQHGVSRPLFPLCYHCVPPSDVIQYVGFPMVKQPIRLYMRQQTCADLRDHSISGSMSARHSRPIQTYASTPSAYLCQHGSRKARAYPSFPIYIDMDIFISLTRPNPTYCNLTFIRSLPSPCGIKRCPI